MEPALPREARFEDSIASAAPNVVRFAVVLIAPAPAAHSRVWNPTFAGVVLVGAALLAYGNSFSGPFVYDDVAAIPDNPTIRQLWPLSAVLSPPNDTGTTVNGRPLLNLSFALNYAVGGTRVASYHAVNLAIHVLAGLALFGWVRRTLALPSLQSLRARFGPGDGILLPSFCIALLWTLHPLQTASVTYLAQRAESQGGLFFLLTFYCFVRSVDSPRPALWQTLSVLACLGAVGSKEIAAAAPILVLFYDRTFVSGTFRAAWDRHRMLFLGLAATWLPLAGLIVHSDSRGGTAGFGAGHLSSWHYALTSSFAIGQYLKLSLWPSSLVFDYGTAVRHELLSVLPQSILILALLAGTTYSLWRHPRIGFLGLWFFAILAPSSSFVPVATETISEHRMYLPLAALVTLAVIGIGPRLGRGALSAWLGLAVAAGIVTHTRNDVYRDELALWRDAQRHYPTNARAHNNVGEILFRRGRPDEAIACFRTAVQLDPGYIDALNNLGNRLTQVGQAADALPWLQRALQRRPDSSAAHNNLGNAIHRLGRKEEAVRHFRAALRLNPTFAEAHNNLGVVLSELNQTAEAITHFEAILRIDPTDAKAHHNLGSLLLQQGRIEEAKLHYETAIRLNAHYPDAETNLGALLCQTGRPAEALRHFENALRLSRDSVTAKENLFVVHTSLGVQAMQAEKTDEAQKHFEQAVRFNPANADAHNNLGVVLWRQGLGAQALPRFEEAVRLKPDFTDAKIALAELRAQLGAARP